MTPDDPLVGNAAATLSVRLYLDAEGRPVGSVRCMDGPERSFVGWLALMAECSSLVDPPPRADASIKSEAL